MRVALLIAGYLRTFKVNIKTIKSRIIEHFGDVDVYIHVTKQEAKGDRYFNISNSDEAIALIHDELHPVALLCEENAQFGDDRAHNNIYNLWMKYHKLNQIKLINEQTGGFKYDVVIKFRPDLDIVSTNIFTGDTVRSVVYIPTESVIDKNKLKNPDDNFICDIFAYGNSSVMDRYFGIFRSLDDLTARHGTVSETVLYHYLNESGIDFEFQDIEYNVLLSSCNIFAICGDSGSGKTTLGKLLKKYFSDSFLLEGDRYHKWERHNENWSKFTHLNPESNYLAKMTQDIFDLKVGKTVYQVDYDHKTGKFTDSEAIEPSDNIIVCGLNSLYSDNNSVYNLKIFIDTDERLKTRWKIRRDVHERGHSLDHVLQQIERRRSDYGRFIATQLEKSDLVINFYPRSDDDADIDDPDNLALKLLIRNDFNISEITHGFLLRDIPVRVSKTETFYELSFDRYQKRTFWADSQVPHSDNFYDYIVFVIFMLRSV